MTWGDMIGLMEDARKEYLTEGISQAEISDRFKRFCKIEGEIARAMASKGTFVIRLGVNIYVRNNSSLVSYCDVPDVSDQEFTR
jgi:hypothetical protein